MIVMTPEELAESWGIKESEVMERIKNTLNGNIDDGDKLPDTFMVRKHPDCYRIIIPDGYKFSHMKKYKTSLANK